MEKVKFPEKIIQKLKLNAPDYAASENWGRRIGIYGDHDETSKGYKSICIYIQNGLHEYLDLFKEVTKGIFKIQSNNTRKYPLLVFGFGNTEHLQHEKKFFDFGYINDSQNYNKVAETIARVSGSIPCCPAIIPELFPRTDARSLYSGKIKIEKEDLLIIIGRANEVFLSETLKEKITSIFKRQVLFIIIGKKEVEFRIKDIEFKFKPIMISPVSKLVAPNTKTFKREFSASLIGKLKPENLFNYLHPNILKGDIFPAIRYQFIDFYYKGGRLFKFDKDGFHTHIKYAAVLEKVKDDYLTESEMGNQKLASDFSSNYSRIKENCSMYAPTEASNVAEIYHKHSYVASDAKIVVLDIEVSFKSLDPDGKQDRIDILLFNKAENKLKFVEAKHYSNSEIWSKNEAKVIGQIKRYEAQIYDKKPEILLTYNKYIDTVNTLFNLSLPHVNEIDEKVTLLIFGFDNDQKKGRLRTLITENEKFKHFIVYPIGNPGNIKLENLWKAK